MRNVFLQLYTLARKENYNPSYWRDLIVGAYRNSESRCKTKEVCLLYYALSKASKQTGIAALRITFRKSRQDKTPVTIGLGEVIDVYEIHIQTLLKYMSISQLAMVSRSLAMLNRLDHDLCSVILSRISYSRIKITHRPLCSLVCTLAKSGLIAGESLRTILLEKVDYLRQANKLDTIELCKAMLSANIRDEDITNFIHDKLKDFCNDFSSTELLSVLSWLCAVRSKDMTLLQRLQPVLRANVEKYTLKDICNVSRALTVLKADYCGDFFKTFLHPCIHVLLRTNRMDEISQYILQYYVTATVADCVIPLYPLLQILKHLTTSEEWALFFRILYQYQVSVGHISAVYKEDSGKGNKSWNTSEINLNISYELEEAWTMGIKNFLNWLECEQAGYTGLDIITGIIVDCARCDSAFIYRLSVMLSCNTLRCPNVILVDILYTIHAVPGFETRSLLELLIDSNDDYNTEKQLKLLSMEMFLNMDITAKFLKTLRIYAEEKQKVYQDQEEEWVLPNVYIVEDNSMVGSDLVPSRPVSFEVMCYLLATFVLREGRGYTYEGYSVSNNDLSLCKRRIRRYRGDISALIKMMRPECVWLQRILLCISILDPSIYEEYVTKHGIKARMKKAAYSFEHCEEFMTAGTTMKAVVIQSGDISTKIPVFKLSGIDYAFINRSHLSTKWDAIWARVMDLILTFEGYKVVKCDRALSEVIINMERSRLQKA